MFNEFVLLSAAAKSKNKENQMNLDDAIKQAQPSKIGLTKVNSKAAEVRKNLAAIEEALAKGVTIKSIADQAGINYVHLTSLIRAARNHAKGLTQDGKPRKQKVWVSPMVFQEEALHPETIEELSNDAAIVDLQNEGESDLAW